MDQWQRRAACVGEDPSIFHILAKEDPGCEDLSEVKRKALENSNFLKAEAICLKCPVRRECLVEGKRIISSSVEQETYTYASWSFRGGLPPTLSTPRANGRPAKYVEGRPCPQGHPAERIYINGRTRYCRDCESIRKGGKAKAPAPPHRTVRERHDLGEFDHEFRGRPAPYGASCATCRNQGRRKHPYAETPEDRHRGQFGHKPRYSKTSTRRRCLECTSKRNAKRTPELRAEERERAQKRALAASAKA